MSETVNETYAEEELSDESLDRAAVSSAGSNRFTRCARLCNLSQCNG